MMIKNSRWLLTGISLLLLSACGGEMDNDSTVGAKNFARMMSSANVSNEDLAEQDADAIKMYPRIIGGEDAALGNWPYMVSIHFPATSGEHGCGGTLIAPDWVLTAAHCVEDEQFNGIFVYTGLYQQSAADYANAIPVRRYIMHPQYDNELLTNDIALIELAQSASQTPVTLNSGGIMPYWSFALGWGLTSVDGWNSDILQYLAMPLVTNDVCNSVYQPMDSYIHPTQICAGYYEGGQDTCQNDSGGPLLVRTPNGEVQQVGIVSYGQSPDGTPCAGANSYGVYTRVSSYLDFIRQYVPTVQAAAYHSTFEFMEATLSDTLTLNIPSLAWNNGNTIPLSATLEYMPGTEFSFFVSSYSEISVQQDYAAKLTQDLLLTVPKIRLWDNSSIWATLEYDPRYQDDLVFSLIDYGEN